MDIELQHFFTVAWDNYLTLEQKKHEMKEYVRDLGQIYRGVYGSHGEPISHFSDDLFDLYTLHYRSHSHETVELAKYTYQQLKYQPLHSNIFSLAKYTYQQLNPQ